jgi:hypothetical protein
MTVILINRVVASIAFALGLHPGADAAGQTIDKKQLNAIFTDPQRDMQHPSWNEAIWIPSGGVLINGVIYAASSTAPHCDPSSWLTWQ